MAEMAEKFNQLWQRTSLIQRIILVGVVLGAVGTVAVLVGWARKPELTVLYSRLDSQEAGLIVEKIEEEGVTYEVATRQDGATIKVPRDQVHGLRLTMAAQGLPAGGNAGYGVLDDSKIGQSPFMQRKNYNRAIEGELARTIENIEAVGSARVHVVKPDSTLFGGEDKQASASVLVRTTRNKKITEGNVSAIIHFIAGAVEGLAPSNVAVIDQNGKLLSGETEDGITGRASSVLALKSDWESLFVEKVEAVLKPVLGPDRIAVRVDVQLDMTSTEMMEETADDKGVVIEETIEERSSSMPQVGQQGVGANQAGGATRESSSKSKIRPVISVKKGSIPPGRVVSKHVAVVVDLSPPAPEEGQEEQQPVPAGELMEIDEVKKLVAGAVGLGKDDTIEVVNRKFQGMNLSVAGALEEPPGDPMDFYLEIARRSSLGVLVVGALIALRIFRGPKRKRSAAHDVQVSEEGNLLPEETQKSDMEAMREKISSALQQDPEQLKQLFLSWAQVSEEE